MCFPTSITKTFAYGFETLPKYLNLDFAGLSFILQLANKKGSLDFELSICTISGILCNISGAKMTNSCSASY